MKLRTRNIFTLVMNGFVVEMDIAFKRLIGGFSASVITNLDTKNLSDEPLRV